MESLSIKSLGDHRDFNSKGDWHIVSHVQLDVENYAQQMVQTTVLCAHEVDEPFDWTPAMGIDKYLWVIPTLGDTTRAVYSHDDRFFGIYTLTPVEEEEEWFVYHLSEGKMTTPLRRVPNSVTGEESPINRFPSEMSAINYAKAMCGTSNYSSYFRPTRESEAPHLQGGDEQS